VADLISTRKRPFLFASGYGRRGYRRNIAVIPHCRSRFTSKRWRRPSRGR
jgi:hypothetical protein